MITRTAGFERDPVCHNALTEAATLHSNLSVEIDDHRFRYYIKDAPVISDEAFDQLVLERRALEKAHSSLRH